MYWSYQLVQYNLPSYKRDPNKMDWVDTSIDAVIGRIIVNMDVAFAKNIMVRNPISLLELAYFA